jgi:hypothetical protein
MKWKVALSEAHLRPTEPTLKSLLGPLHSSCLPHGVPHVPRSPAICGLIYPIMIFPEPCPPYRLHCTFPSPSPSPDNHRRSRTMRSPVAPTNSRSARLEVGDVDVTNEDIQKVQSDENGGGSPVSITITVYLGLTDIYHYTSR